MTQLAQLLKKVATGTITPEEAEREIREAGYLWCIVQPRTSITDADRDWAHKKALELGYKPDYGSFAFWDNPLDAQYDTFTSETERTRGKHLT